MKWAIQVEDLKSGECTTHTVDKDVVVIGRTEPADVVVPNTYVSRQHITLSCDYGTIFVEDMNSANKTHIRRGGRYEKLIGKTDTKLPIQLILGPEISLSVSAPSVSDVGKTIISAPKTKVFLSQVLSIENLQKEEALMVLDLCESTSLANQDETLAFHSKRRLESIAQSSLSLNHVRFYKSTGDGFLSCFPMARDALSAARSICQALAERNKRTKNPPIQIRIALHRGKTYCIDAQSGDIHGNDVNMTFRLEGVQAGSFAAPLCEIPLRDRILCSRAFMDDIIIQCPEEKGAFTACGLASLKGIELPVEVYAVRIEEC
jgi:class 3 adenylate cyclase